MEASATRADQGLLGLAPGGSSAALTNAYRSHAGAVGALAQRLLGNPAHAEDVVQEVFLRLWNAPSKFEPTRGPLRSYLLAQSHGRSIDQQRSESARLRREVRAGRFAGGCDPGFEEDLCDAETAEEVRAALVRLPEAQRRAITLAYFEGFTYRQVAALLGEPEGTVKSRISAGLRHMRRSLALDSV